MSIELTLNRLQLESDMFEDVVKKMSDGYPGAGSVLLKLMDDNRRIDPFVASSRFIVYLDSFQIYGNRIWMLFVDVCSADMVAFCAVIRAAQLELLPLDKLNHAIDNRGDGINVAEICESVKNHLGTYLRPDHPKHLTEICSQEHAADYFLPIIQSSGRSFKKIGRVGARDAVVAEKIVTFTADGKETENVAKEGDVVIQNTTGEQYIISGDKFKKRYVLVEEVPSIEGWKTYDPIGECEAAEFKSSIFNLPNPFYFMASWGEKMVIKDGDMLATIDRKEVYRIARAEFDQTYQKK